MRAPARHQRDDLVDSRELPGVFSATLLNVAQIVQSIEQLTDADRLSRVQLERSCEDTGQNAFAFAVEALVDLTPQDDVVIPKDNDETRRDGARSQDGAAPPRRIPPGDPRGA